MKDRNNEERIWKVYQILKAEDCFIYQNKGQDLAILNVSSYLNLGC